MTTCADGQALEPASQGKSEMVGRLPIEMHPLAYDQTDWSKQVRAVVWERSGGTIPE